MTPTRGPAMTTTDRPPTVLELGAALLLAAASFGFFGAAAMLAAAALFGGARLAGAW